MDAKRHWEEIYVTKAATDVSWFQPEARLSLELIQEAVPDGTSAILDVGGGASTLVDGLLGAGCWICHPPPLARPAGGWGRGQQGLRGSMPISCQSSCLRQHLTFGTTEPSSTS